MRFAKWWEETAAHALESMSAGRVVPPCPPNLTGKMAARSVHLLFCDPAACVYIHITRALVVDGTTTLIRVVTPCVCRFNGARWLEACQGKKFVAGFFMKQWATMLKEVRANNTARAKQIMEQRRREQ